MEEDEGKIEFLRQMVLLHGSHSIRRATGADLSSDGVLSAGDVTDAGDDADHASSFFVR